jgi:uncharacterized membrane protein
MKLSWFTIGAGVVAGGIIHIAAVLGAPYLAQQDGWGRLATISATNQLYVLPPGAPELVPMPMAAPDIGYAFCRFDLTDGNVVFESPIPSRVWSAAMHTRYGENFYVISGADIQRRRIRMLLVPRERLAEEASTDVSERGEEQIIVISPSLQGTITIRLPNRGKPFTQRTIAALQAGRCGDAEEIERAPVEKQTPPGFPPLPSPRVPAVMNLTGGIIN